MGAVDVSDTDDKERGWWTGTRAIVALAAALVGIVAGVITTIIAVQDRPPPYTLKDWAQQANAICDQYRPQLTAQMRGFTDALIKVEETPDSKGNYEAAARVFEDAADAYSQMAGRLRGIRVPVGDAQNIEKIFEHLGAFDALLREGADHLREFDPKDPTKNLKIIEHLEASLHEMSYQSKSGTESLQASGATRCIL